MSFLTSSAMLHNVYIPIITSAGPKSVGGAFRVKDDWNAPWKIKKDTIIRESATVAQVSVYSVLINQMAHGIKTMLHNFAEKNPASFIASAMKKGGNKSLGNTLFYIALACASNYIAETVSRKFAPRDIWEHPPESLKVGDHDNDEDEHDHFKDKDGPQENRPDSLEGHKRAEPKSNPAAVALRFAQSEPLRHQPLTFSRSNNAPITYRPPNANPFQFAVQPAFAKPAFSI